MSNTEEFICVTKKPRKAKVPDIKEQILVFSDAYDWKEGLTYVGEISSVKDLESFAEKKRLPWYYHGFSPSRKLIFTCIKGEKSAFDADQSYIDRLITQSNAPAEVIKSLKSK